MYTEGEPKEKVRKLDSMSPSDSPPAQQTAIHGCEVPPQHSPEVLPPVSAAHSGSRVPSSQITPGQSISSNALHSQFSPSMQHSDGKPEQLQHHHPHQHLQQPHHQHLQQHSENDLQHDRDHNSDSDSSSVNGTTDISRRFRECVPDEQKDNLYWEKRRKNNEAARKSREKRRMHDMVLEGRINCLEDDNTKLRRELLALKKKFNLPDGQQYYDGQAGPEVAEPCVQRIRSPSPPTGGHIQTTHQTSPPSGVNKPSSILPYNSPPPLMTVGDSMPMGVAMYSGGSNPFFMSETSRINPDGSLKTPILSGHHNHPHHQVPSQHLQRSAYPLDMVKEEQIEEGEVRSRERSNSSVERRPTYRVDSPEASLLRRASFGNYSQYRPPLSPPISQVNHHHHRPYVNSHISQAHYMQRTYDNHSMSLWSQRSPVSSHSSDDNYDEPLQLTVRRDSNVSIHSSIPMDDSSRECDSNVATAEKSSLSVSPPASSLPLKLRHKLPSHDLTYPKEIFPNMPPAPITVTPSSYPTHPFLNGITHLSDLALSQNNPLSLKIESPTAYTNRKDSRVSSRRGLGESKFLDPKYLERRRRNNEAARKCRENRKTLTKIREAKSDYLETENSKLRDELNSLQEEMKQLRDLIEKKRLEQGIKDEPNVES